MYMGIYEHFIGFGKKGLFQKRTFIFECKNTTK